jgi:heterodisulfide reductase subunit C
MRGRPSKLTEELKANLTKVIAAGNYYQAACDYVGISYSIFREWIVKGEQAKSGKYFDFSEAVKKAEAQAEIRMVQEWQKQMPENWQAIATFMERRYPDRWGRQDKSKVELTGKDGGAIKIESPREDIMRKLNSIASRETEERDT